MFYQNKKPPCRRAEDEKPVNTGGFPSSVSRSLRPKQSGGLQSAERDKNPFSINVGFIMSALTPQGSKFYKTA